MGQIIDAIGSLGFQIDCGAEVQFPAIVFGQTMKQGLAEFVVNKCAAAICRLGPDDVPLLRFVQGRHRLRRSLPRQLRCGEQIKLFAEDRAHRKQLRARLRQQFDAAGEQRGGVP